MALSQQEAQNLQAIAENSRYKGAKANFTQSSMLPGQPKTPGFSAGNLLHSAVTLGGQALGAIGHAAIQGFRGLQTDITGSGVNQYEAKVADIGQRQDRLVRSFKNGEINKTDYVRQLNDLADEAKANGTEAADYAKNFRNNVAKHYVQAAGTVLSAVAPFAAPAEIAGEGGIYTGARLAARAAESAVGGTGGSILTAPIKNALITQPTISTPGQLVKAAKDKNYGELALQAGLLAGLPLAGKLAGPVVSEGLSALKTKTFGKVGGPLAEFFGNDAVKAAIQDSRYANLAKQAEGFTLNQDTTNPVDFFHHYMTGVLHLDPKTTTLPQFLDRFEAYAQTVGKLSKAQAAGKAAPSLVVSADYKSLAPNIIKDLSALDKTVDFQSLNVRQELANQIVDKLGIQNPTTADNLRNAILNGHTVEESIQQVEATVKELQHSVIEVPGLRPPKGFIFTIGPGKTAELPSAANAAELKFGKGASGVPGAIGRKLTSAGLSPETSPNIAPLVKDNFKTALKDTAFASEAGPLYAALEKEAGRTRGVLSPQFLSKRAIGRVLDEMGISDSQAGTVRKALDQAMLNLSTAERGLGGKATDLAVKFVPGERQFLKIQNYGRFALNPFFAAKVATKSTFLGALENTGGHLAGPVSDDIVRYTRTLRQGLGAEAADLLGGLPAQVRPGMVGKLQDNIAANLAQNILKSNQATIADIATNPALKRQIDDAVQIIYGYPKHGFLNSNLAKSLNVVIFPSRFEAKVLTATAKFFAKQPTIARAMLLNGLLKGNAWLGSGEGKQWQKDNSELVDIVKYFTPFDTMSKVLGVLSGNKDGTTIKDLGAVGGLPFGLITEMLSHQGVKLGPFQSSQFVPTKTGTPIEPKLPVNTRGRAYQALSDLVSQMYSYPGAQIGLPSKADATKQAIRFGTAGQVQKNPADFSGPETAPAKNTNLLNVPKSYRSVAPTAVPSLPKRAPRPPRGAKVKAKAKPIGSAF